MPDVPIAFMYSEYADLTRMIEWSPLLESVTVDPDAPNYSVWVMRVPRALQPVAKYLGYEPTVVWEADLSAPGPPTMQWTSSVRAGVQNAGFEPAGEVSFQECRSASERTVTMSLTLRYTLPEPAARWKIALVLSPVVQGILRSRMVAGMQRFAAAMEREYKPSLADSGATASAASTNAAQGAAIGSSSL